MGFDECWCPGRKRIYQMTVPAGLPRLRHKRSWIVLAAEPTFHYPMRSAGTLRVVQGGYRRCDVWVFVIQESGGGAGSAMSDM